MWHGFSADCPNFAFCVLQCLVKDTAQRKYGSNGIGMTLENDFTFPTICEETK